MHIDIHHEDRVEIHGPFIYTSSKENAMLA